MIASFASSLRKAVESQTMLSRVSLRSAFLHLAYLAALWTSSAPPAAAQSQTRYAQTVDVVTGINGWDYESQAEGAPVGVDCNSGPTTYAVQPGAHFGTAWLTASAFSPFAFPSGSTISSVQVRILMRFDMGKPAGQVDVGARVNGAWSITANNFNMPTPSDGNCSYYTFNVPAPTSGWTPANVSSMGVRVRRTSNSTLSGNLRVKAFEIIANYSIPPSSAPTLTSPVGGVVVQWLPVSLTWTPVAASSAYDVELDGSITSVSGATSLPVSPAIGSHSWRVRGTNGAGAGPWSASAAFVVPQSSPCATGGSGGAWPNGGIDGSWPSTLPTGQLSSPMFVTVPSGASHIIAVRLHGFATTYIGDHQFVLEDPTGKRHNIFYRPGSVQDSPGDECTTSGGDFTIVGVLTAGNALPLECNSNGELEPGVYEQHFGDWPNGACSIFNTTLDVIPVTSGVYTLHCYDWYVGLDNGVISGWELCFGTSTLTTSFCEQGPCPCGNAGLPGRGCNNSANTGGGRLDFSGQPSVSSDTLTLSATGLPPSSVGFLLQSLDRRAAPFGDGLLCLSTFSRLWNSQAPAGTVQFGSFAESGSIGELGQIPPSGGTFLYQVAYRDPSTSYCSYLTFNFTQGVAVTWVP